MDNLKTEDEIIQNWIGDIKNPKVSICCITYNHALYIEDALTGFLIQETDYPFEILIHDDASPDETVKIIEHYHHRYPNIIKPMYQIENQYSKGGIHPNLEFNYPRAKGEYIALCDGDDYWTDPQKIAKQVSFLETNKKFVGTAHNVIVINEKGEKLDDNKSQPYRILPSHTFDLKDAENFKLAGQTSSILYRNIWGSIDEHKLNDFKEIKSTGDKKLALLMTLYGDVYYFSDTMAIHRKITNSGTSWSARFFDKNMALYRYQELISIKKFAENSFGITLNNKKQRMNAFYNAIIFYLRKPNKENRDIIKEIIELDYDKRSELVLYVPFNILLWPLRRLKRRLKHVK